MGKSMDSEDNRGGGKGKGKEGEYCEKIRAGESNKGK